jgi:hypothetical protein
MSVAMARLRLRLRSNAWIFRHFGARREHPLLTRRIVRPGDDAVIEGFPRSANTFASAAFELSQPGEVRFGNHFHNPAQFILAKEYGIPAMLVLREPIAACRSYVLHSPGLTAAAALERYIAFHRPLLAIGDFVSVAPFEEVTTDFGQSILRMNRKFGCDFSAFVHTEENVRKAFATIEHRRSMRLAAGVVRDNPLAVTVPTAEKGERKLEAGLHFENPDLADLKATAASCYSNLLMSMS